MKCASTLFNLLLSHSLYSASHAWRVDDRCLDPNKEYPELEGGKRNLMDYEIDHFPDNVETWENNKPSAGTHNFEEQLAEENAGRNLRGSSAESNLVATHRDLQDERTFNMKIHWTPGACWQLEWNEREWCMQCDGTQCGGGDLLMVQECNRDIPQQRFQWIATGHNTGKLKTAYHDFCLTHQDKNQFKLRKCSERNQGQIFERSNMGNVFELFFFNEARNLTMCLNNEHHPRADEEIMTTTCWKARNWMTSKWHIAWPSSGRFDPNDDGYGGRNSGTSGPELSLRRAICTAKEPCGMCEGDCNGDKQCVGGLKCFHRNMVNFVPGCSGHGVIGEDYCYSPDGIEGVTESMTYYQVQEAMGNILDEPEDQVHVEIEPNAEDPYDQAQVAVETDDNPDHQVQVVIERNVDDQSARVAGTPEPPRLTNRVCTNSEPCGMCEGDCDDDKHCQQGLECFRRNDNAFIPGCSGQGVQGDDYCYNPWAETSGNEVMLRRDIEQCDPNDLCDECEGDCDTDNDCRGGLVCFERNGDEPIESCAGRPAFGRDYCIQP